MDQWRGRVALVTGASSGIGAAITTELVRHGLVVIGCGRNMERLEKFGDSLKSEQFPGSYHSVQCDLAVEGSIIDMFVWIKDNHGGIDVLINNAGLSHPGSILTGQTDQWRHMMEVNVIGLAKCTQLAYQSMTSRNVDDGYIININSLLGHRVAPAADLSMYSASKFAVSAINHATRQELRQAKSGIRITSISPGIVSTEFFPRMYEGEGSPARQGFPFKTLDADNIASCVIHALSLPPHAQIDDMIVRAQQQPV